jgi:hypothetical protein
VSPEIANTYCLFRPIIRLVEYRLSSPVETRNKPFVGQFLTDWFEAVAKARYLLILFAQSPAAEDLRRARLNSDVFADFERLLAEPKRPPVGCSAWLAPASLIRRRIAMAKGQQRGNCEAKKPKKEKPKVAATAQTSFGLNPQKSTGTKDDRGKKK